MSDLNINGVNASSAAHIHHSAPGTAKPVTDSSFLFATFLPLPIYSHTENEFQN